MRSTRFQNINRQIVYLFLTLTTLSCYTPSLNNNRTMQATDTKTIENQIGYIGYWQEHNQYTISFSIPNTIDGQITALLAPNVSIPDLLKKEGTKVVFTAKLIKNKELPPPRMGGETVYLIQELSSIKAYE